jgi:hypothetical protein
MPIVFTSLLKTTFPHGSLITFTDYIAPSTWQQRNLHPLRLGVEYDWCVSWTLWIDPAGILHKTFRCTRPLCRKFVLKKVYLELWNDERLFVFVWNCCQDCSIHFRSHVCYYGGSHVKDRLCYVMLWAVTSKGATNTRQKYPFLCFLSLAARCSFFPVQDGSDDDS